MTEERPTLEDITNRVEKSPEAIKHGPNLELQSHWFRLHLEIEAKIPMSDKKVQEKRPVLGPDPVLDYHIGVAGAIHQRGQVGTKRDRKTPQGKTRGKYHGVKHGEA
eukprot:CAMPEP_0194534922 /NCGR_PEP_ID=MMETSP0253-20130528/73287_1 /TAXON_ID=2966 /ORGANISM="Noctiluca scintillans" /LENGTH=106 /DNA_ID=CAMNT_0039380629 /DNA_START=850 /DNA_END=1170 /DNA_ORIENTATION=-